MSQRKRWRTLLVPTFTYSNHQSQVAAYRYVDRLRQERLVGMTRVERVRVEVDEGTGWRLYETVVMPPIPQEYRHPLNSIGGTDD